MRDSQNLTTHSVACGDLLLSVVVCGFQTYRSTCRPTIALLWPPYGIGEAIIFLSCGFFYLLLLSFFLAYSQPSQIGCLPYLRMTNYHIGPHRTKRQTYNRQTQQCKQLGLYTSPTQKYNICADKSPTHASDNIAAHHSQLYYRL